MMIKTKKFDWLDPKSWKHRYEDRKIKQFLSKTLGLEANSFIIIASDEDIKKPASRDNPANISWRISGRWSAEIFEYLKRSILTQQQRN